MAAALRVRFAVIALCCDGKINLRKFLDLHDYFISCDVLTAGIWFHVNITHYSQWITVRQFQHKQ